MKKKGKKKGEGGEHREKEKRMGSWQDVGDGQSLGSVGFCNVGWI